MNKIAKRAGVSAGLVAYYYKDKETLISETLRDAHARFSAQVIDAAGPRAPDWHRIQAWFKTWFPNRDPDAPPVGLWLEFWAHAARDSHLSAYQSERFLYGRDLFSNHVRDGLAKGELVQELDPDLVAELFMVLNIGLTVAVSITDTVTPERAGVIAELVFRLLSSQDSNA